VELRMNIMVAHHTVWQTRGCTGWTRNERPNYGTQIDTKIMYNHKSYGC